MVPVIGNNPISDKKRKLPKGKFNEKQNNSVATELKQKLLFTKEDLIQSRRTWNGCGLKMRNLSDIIKLNGTIDVEPESMASVLHLIGGY